MAITVDLAKEPGVKPKHSLSLTRQQKRRWARTSACRALFLSLGVWAAGSALPAAAQSVSAAQSAPGQGAKSKPVTAPGANRVTGRQWDEFINSWRASTPVELERVGKKVDALHLAIGDWPLGQLFFHDSPSNNFITGSYFPNIAAGYVYWKAAHLTTDPNRLEEKRRFYNKAVNALFPVVEPVGPADNRPGFYQLPVIQLIYVASSLKSGQYDPKLIERLKALNRWRRDHLDQASSIAKKTIVEREWPTREKKLLQETNPFADLQTLLGREGRKLEAEVADRVKNNQEGVNEALASIEFAQMRSASGQSIPELLAHRLIESEDEVLRELRDDLSIKPRFTLLQETNLANGSASSAPVVTGIVRYAFPLEISAVDGQKQNRPLGPTALKVFENKFRLELDRADKTTECQIAWSVSADHRKIVEKFTNDYLRFLPTLQDIDSGKYPVASTGAGATSRKPSFQTNLSKGDAWLATSQAVEVGDNDRIPVTVSTSNCKQLEYWLTAENQDQPLPRTRRKAPLLAGSKDGDMRFNLHLIKSGLPVGQYQLHLRMTESDSPTEKDWVDAIVPEPIGLVDRRVAFIVGIENYSQDVLNLHYAAADARDFCDRVKSVYKFAPQNIVYLYGGNGETDSDGKPKPGAETLATDLTDGEQPGAVDSTDFQQAFRRFMVIAKNRHATNVVLYYSGHGLQEDNYNSLLCHDSNSFKISQLLYDLTTYMGMDRPGRKCNIVGLFDACRNISESFAPTPITFPNTPGVKYIPIYSCDAGESSEEFTEIGGTSIKHGIFTYALLEKMMANASGLTIQQLAEGVSGVMSERLLAAGGNRKSPTKSTEGPQDNSSAIQQHLRLNSTKIETPEEVKTASEPYLNETAFGALPARTNTGKH